MKGISAGVVIAVILLVMSGCSRDIVPDSVLQGLHKPMVSSVNPAAIRSSGGGFLLTVMMDLTEDDQYVFYIDEHQVGQVSRGERSFAANAVGCMVEKETLDKLFAASPNGGTFSVRVTGISENYDISGDFERYRDYVSEPLPVAIGRGDTPFAVAKQLFPEWVHSSEPIVRCDSGGNTFVVWREKVGAEYRAFFSFSPDAGATWSQVLDISRASGSVDGIDITGGEGVGFYMTWRGTASGSADVYFSRSHNFGYSWYAPKRMNAEGEKVSLPALAVDDLGHIFLAWLRFNGANAGPTLRLAVSRDLGYNWTIRNFELPANFSYWRPLLVARWQGRIDLLQGRLGANSLHFRQYSSSDYGNSWQEKDVAVGDCSWGDLNPLFRFAPGGRAYVVWGASSYAGHYFSHWNYFLNRDVDGNWGAIQDLHQVCPASDERTALAVSANSADTVLTGPGCLFLLRSRDGGRSWPVPEAVPGSEGFRLSGAQDMAAHPSGKTFLVFLKETGEESCLYFTQFE